MTEWFLIVDRLCSTRCRLRISTHCWRWVTTTKKKWRRKVCNMNFITAPPSNADKPLARHIHLSACNRAMFLRTAASHIHKRRTDRIYQTICLQIPGGCKRRQDSTFLVFVFLFVLTKLHECWQDRPGCWLTSAASNLSQTRVSLHRNSYQLNGITFICDQRHAAVFSYGWYTELHSRP